MLFTRKKRTDKVQLKLYSQSMERVTKFKYLGLWFDEKCIWRNHIDQIETKCKKVINLMRSVTGYEWGADKLSLMDIYRALIRSCLDYGCMVYGAAAKSILEKLDKIQFRALRISIGAVKTTPTNALLVEANELPLYLRRSKLSLVYWVKLKGSGEEQPAIKVLNDCWEYAQQRKFKGFGWNIQTVAEEYGLNRVEYGPNTVWGNVPPWILPVPKVNFHLIEQKRVWAERNEDNIGYLVNNYVKINYYNYMTIFTDRSKNPGSEHVGAGVYIPEFNVEISKIIIDGVSVFTSEIVAIILGLQWIEEVRPERVVICSDSAAALSSLNSKETSRDDLLLEIFTIMLRIQRAGTDVQFCWVPAHIGVEGNEKADEIAKRALKLNENEIMKIPYWKGEAKSLIIKAVRDLWQKKWDTDNKGRHYYNIQKSITVKTFKGKCRKEEVMLKVKTWTHRIKVNFVFNDKMRFW